MQRYFFIFSLLLFTVLLSSGAPEDFNKLLEDRKVEMDFSVKVRNSDRFGDCAGSLTYQDGAFRINMDGFQAYSDKNDMWTVNEVSKEAIVEKASSYDFLSHPEQLLELLGINPKKATLSPRYDSSGLPSGIDLTLKDGTAIELVFTKVASLPAGSLDDFAFNGDSLAADYVITDLR